MQYVDEFRRSRQSREPHRGDQELTQKLPISRDEPLHIMEVCGGHTHAIFRYGISRHAADGNRIRARARLPVCVLPMGRVDDCVAIAERPE